ncbi:PASTA domain-containing protein [Mesohalobacter halotolerans]|uniref:PASTA domain-containing protein n=1 Tax=Mesohalobacter halotolerans TaxID=1883405 RepID=A0A4U5TP49_9FLAO|nr:PASTA domain-containing protein [Mesohalobacter halotolerans]MBS3737521.1 PASTA domain-containing protein [Psychroflexus sp.]TKS55703.1 PASTA domain-containing protein [Mesohalobacter halotolerans]
MSFFKFLLSKTFFKNLIIAVFVSFAIIVGLFYWLNYYTNHNDYIEVPDLSKLEMDIVEKKLDQMGLRYVIMDSTAYNPEYPSFSVVDQNPKPGQSVKENRKIYLTINPKDFAFVNIPDNIIGNTKRQVLPTLQSLGFKIGKISTKPDIARDVVLELKQDDKVLKPGDKLKKTSVIDIVVGDGSLNYLESNSSKSSKDEE